MENNLPASTKILFIADAHLGGFSIEKNQQIEAALIHLINYAQDHGYKMAVLGDLFDYWMEYENYIPEIGQNVLTRFADFNKNNDSLYITGNHDNWTNGYFQNIGFDVEQDYRLLEIGSQKVLLLHGDAIGKDLHHLQRPLLHRLLRNKNFIKWYKRILGQPERGVRVMRWYSRFSGNIPSGKPDPLPLDKWSKTMLRDNEIDVIICGHDHIPRVKTYNSGIYLNTGTFYAHKTLVTYNNQQFQLVLWNEGKRELTPYRQQY